MSTVRTGPVLALALFGILLSTLSAISLYAALTIEPRKRRFRWGVLFALVAIFAVWVNAVAVFAVTFDHTGGPVAAFRPFYYAMFIATFVLHYICVVRGYAIQTRRDEAHQRGRCRNCDYDLTDNESGICPECGELVAKVDVN